MSDLEHSVPSEAEASAETTTPSVSLWRRLRTTPLIDALRGQLSGRLDVPALLNASELPDAARRRILAIVKRTRLWRIEKASVAGELVAHFADGLEAGTSLDDLLESFGDVRTTARLIRRAKVRCRPLAWHALRRIVHALAIFLVVYASAAIYFAMDKPTVSVNYFAEINEEILAMPEEQRGWPIYREALLTFDRRGAEEILKMDGLEPGGENWQHAVDLLREVEPALALTRQAAARPHLGYVLSAGINAEDRELWPTYYESQRRRAAETETSESNGWETSETSMYRLLFSHVDPLRLLTRLLVLDAKHALSISQPDNPQSDRIVADIVALLGIARQQNEAGFVLEHFVAFSTMRMAADLTDDILRHHADKLTDDQLRNLAHAFAAQGLAPAMSIRHERAYFYDIAQRMYTDDGHGDGRLAPGGLRLLAELSHDDEDWVMGENAKRGAEIAALPLASATIASRKEMLTKFDAIVDRAEAHLARPHWETRATEDSADTGLTNLNEQEKAKFPLIQEVIDEVRAARLTQQYMAGQRDGILVALALELHRRREGWPQTLHELTPDLLPSVPRDRFTGNPLRYRVAGDEAVVYSVGRDLDDDGGAPPDLGESLYLVDETPKDRYHRHNESASVRWDYPSRPPPDGDWILWRSAGWKDERGPVAPNVE